MRLWKWLAYICPWINSNNYPNCETCEFYYAIKPKESGFCLWDHDLITTTDKKGNIYKTPILGICRDYQDNRK